MPQADPSKYITYYLFRFHEYFLGSIAGRVIGSLAATGCGPAISTPCLIWLERSSALTKCTLNCCQRSLIAHNKSWYLFYWNLAAFLGTIRINLIAKHNIERKITSAVIASLIDRKPTIALTINYVHAAALVCPTAENFSLENVGGFWQRCPARHRHGSCYG